MDADFAAEENWCDYPRCEEEAFVKVFGKDYCEYHADKLTARSLNEI